MAPSLPSRRWRPPEHRLVATIALSAAAAPLTHLEVADQDLHAARLAPEAVTASHQRPALRC